MATENNQQPVGVGTPQVQLEMVKYHVNFEPKSPPGEDKQWLSMPELPTPQELNPDWDDKEQVKAMQKCLLPNPVEHPWADKNTYLETHYRLQREESITTLRYSIHQFKQNPQMVDDEETCIYTKVYVQGYLMTRLGPICRVRFSTERAGKRIRWNQTRRLTTGSLIALSTAKDCFRTICMPAVVADHAVRDGLDQNPPTIQFYWANINDAIMDPAMELVMIESRMGYFESTRHTMVGLQHAAVTDTPLDKYLVQADKSDLPADFVAKAPTMNLSSLVHHIPNAATLAAMDKKDVEKRMRDAKEALRHYPILDGIDDKLSQYTNLDNSQLEAVHRILTKELAIIQGPPGTGKTFTSVQALRILLQTQERGSNIIVVAAQTNHAVDQILLQLISAGFDIVRLGGRTQSEEMKNYSLYNVRRRVMPKSMQKSDRDFRTFEAARKKNIATLQSVVDDVFPNDVIAPAQLLAAGIITEVQYESLEGDEDWVSLEQSDSPDGILAQWLGPDQLVKVPPMDYKDPIFTVEEEIEGKGIRAEMIDAEDYNIELDDCVGDDDADRGVIHGTFVPIGHVWTGEKAPGFSETDFRIRKEMKKTNLWEITPKFRGLIYRAWQARLLDQRVSDFRKTLADNKRITNNLKINRWYKDTQTIKSTQLEVIGCTTTGLTKYRGLLAALQPRTMLIEEAAETREANIISALYPSLQQLILVGDHQQLRPHCDIRGLSEKPYNMRVSLFERLVKLQMPFTLLNMQRRMIPTLRQVLNGFYPSLQDHPVVTKPNARLPVPGMATESFLFHHTWSEGVDEDLSKFNVLEAEMIVGFIRYLRLNGVHDSQITVLTFYRGQRKKILAEAKRKSFSSHPFTNVYTVDSYQGEENDIIILSLVRSNGDRGRPPQAGFLADQNRGVVSISRARRAFYIFGNVANLLSACEESYDMWSKVYRVFKDQDRFGENGCLPVTCQAHGRTLQVSHPEDWVSNHGGCDLPCKEVLPCGHACGRRCHPMRHDRLVCQAPCERHLRCGHRCEQLCGQDCRCQCSGFTGAYPNDEFSESSMQSMLDSSDQDSYSVVGRTRAKAPTHPRQGTRAGHRGGRGTFPAGRGGFGNRYSHGVRQNVNYSTNIPSATPSNALSTVHGNWNAYNARREDAEAFQHQRATESSNLIDLSDGGLTSPEKEAGPTVKETFRPVTLTTHGKRTVGEGIVSSGNETSSPEKQSSAQRNPMRLAQSHNATKKGLESSAKPTSRALPHRLRPDHVLNQEHSAGHQNHQKQLSSSHQHEENLITFDNGDEEAGNSLATSTPDQITHSPNHNNLNEAASRTLPDTTVSMRTTLGHDHSAPEMRPTPGIPRQDALLSGIYLASEMDGANSRTPQDHQRNMESSSGGFDSSSGDNKAQMQTGVPANGTSPSLENHARKAARKSSFSLSTQGNYTTQDTQHPLSQASPRQRQQPTIDSICPDESYRLNWESENPQLTRKSDADEIGNSETLLDL